MSKFRQNAHAVIIGINKYADPRIVDLAFARADAESIYEVLTDPELGRFLPNNVILLRDEQATQRNIRTAIGTEISRRASEDDLVYIYYAGHGSVEIDPKSMNRDGIETYLVPTDAELDNLFATGIAMEEVQKYFHRIVSKQVLFFIDSCYSGEAGGRTFQNPHYQKRAGLTDEFLDKLSGEGRLVVTACDVNQVSIETKQIGHGLFTYYLIEGLKGAADRDGDGLVTIHELYRYLYDNVSRHARQLGGSMYPIQKGSVKGQIYLTQYETKAQKQANLLNSQASSLFKSEKLDEAYDLWMKVLMFVPNHQEAKQGVDNINQRRTIEQAKKQEILEPRKQIRLLLLDLANKGILSDRILSKALDIIATDPTELSGDLIGYYKLLERLNRKQLQVGEFIEEWYRVHSQYPDTEIRYEKTKAKPDIHVTPVTPVPAESAMFDMAKASRSLRRLLLIQTIGIAIFLLFPFFNLFSFLRFAGFNALGFADFFSDVFDHPEDFVWIYISYIIFCLTTAILSLFIAKISKNLRIKSGVVVGWLAAALHVHAIVIAVLLMAKTINIYDLINRMALIGVTFFWCSIAAVFLAIITYIETIKSQIVKLPKARALKILLNIHLVTALLIIIISLFSFLTLISLWFMVLLSTIFSLSGAMLGEFCRQQNFRKGALLGWSAGASLLILITGDISGTVRDLETGKPLPGATIIVEGTLFGAAADLDGHYQIALLPPGYYPVSVTYIGYGRIRKQVLALPFWINVSGNLDMPPDAVGTGDVTIVSSLSFLPILFPITLIFGVYAFLFIRDYKKFLETFSKYT